MNYNSIEEIFSAGTTNMEVLRNNTKQDDGTDTITGVSWFDFNGTTASTIYASGNSFIGFGSSSEHLKVNRRDGAMYSLYREEGTLYDYYKFLKIRWVGYSRYNQTSSAYAVEYDVILWDTGDISLHMISIPTSYNTGTYSLVASSTYTYTVSDSMPDVTFTKTDDGFTVSNNIINLEMPYERRYLIRAGSDYYTITDNVLTQIEVTDITSATFLNYGITSMPTFSLLTGLSNPEILYWAEKNSVSLSNLTIKGTPPFPQLLHYNVETIPSGTSIYKVEAFDFENAPITVTFDEGTTWKYYNNGWITASAESEGMTPHTLKNISQEQWAEVTTSSNYQFRCALLSTSSAAGSIGVKYTE